MCVCPVFFPHNLKSFVQWKILFLSENWDLVLLTDHHGYNAQKSSTTLDRENYTPAHCTGLTGKTLSNFTSTCKLTRHLSELQRRNVRWSCLLLASSFTSISSPASFQRFPDHKQEASVIQTEAPLISPLPRGWHAVDMQVWDPGGAEHSVPRWPAPTRSSGACGQPSINPAIPSLPTGSRLLPSSTNPYNHEQQQLKQEWSIVLRKCRRRCQQETSNISRFCSDRWIRTWVQIIIQSSVPALPTLAGWTSQNMAIRRTTGPSFTFSFLTSPQKNQVNDNQVRLLLSLPVVCTSETSWLTYGVTGRLATGWPLLRVGLSWPCPTSPQ